VESTAAPAPVERGWGKLILALLAFVLLPTVPQFRALLPVEQTLLLLVPALAACALVGWWAGGKLFLAAAWVALATLIAVQPAPTTGPFFNMARGWGLLLAGAFGLVCLFGDRRPFLGRAFTALSLAMVLSLMMTSLGPLGGGQLQEAVSAELTQRNAQTMQTLRQFIAEHQEQWGQLTARVPQVASLPEETERQLSILARAGTVLFPSLLALESLCALAIAWAAYHRLGRTRLGAPLSRLRDFRFNDQLVWGLIVGLTIVFLPTLAAFRAAGQNLLVFFGALYAVRGLGVLVFFLAPGALVTSLVVGLAMLWWPVLNIIAVLGFAFMLIAAFGLGLGDTWVDWRRRARTTT
jgi:hypothetical protein